MTKPQFAVALSLLVSVARGNTPAPVVGCTQCTELGAWPCFDPDADASSGQTNLEWKPCFSLGPGLVCTEGKVDCRGDWTQPEVTCGGSDYISGAVQNVDIPAAGETLSFNRYDSRSTETRYNFMRITNTQPGAAKAMHVDMDWRDQGWGNRKGMVYACYKGREQRISQISASHTRADVDITIANGIIKDFLEDGEGPLLLRYKVGGGGGHRLTIYSMEVSFLYERPQQVTMTYGDCDNGKHHVMTMGNSCTDFCLELRKECTQSYQHSDRWCNAGSSTNGCNADLSNQICQCGAAVPADTPTPRPTQADDHEFVYMADFPFGTLFGQQGMWATVSTGKILISDASTMHITVTGHGSLDKFNPEDTAVTDFLQVWILDVAAEEETKIHEVDGSEWLGTYTHHFATPVPAGGIIVKIVSHVTGVDEMYGAEVRVDHVFGSDDTVTDFTNPQFSWPTMAPIDVSCNDVTMTWGGWPSEVSWSMTSGESDLQCGLALGTPRVTSMECCLEEGKPYTLVLRDSYGDGWNGAALKFTGAPSVTINYGSIYTLETVWENGQPHFLLPTEEPTESPTPRPTPHPTTAMPTVEGLTCVWVTTTFGSYRSEVSWELENLDDGTSCSVARYAYTDIKECCMTDGSVIKLTMRDSYGDGWNGATVTFGDGQAMTFYSGWQYMVQGQWLSGPTDWLLPTEEPTQTPTKNPTPMPTTPYPTASPTTAMPTVEGLTCAWVTTYFGSYKAEVSWELENVNDGTTCSVALYAYTDILECCMVEGSVVKLTLNDSYGDGWNGATVTFGDGQLMTFTFGYQYTADGQWINGKPHFNVPTPHPTASPTPNPTYTQGNTCGDITMTWGYYPNEIRWQLQDLDYVTGNDPNEHEFCEISWDDPRVTTKQCCFANNKRILLEMEDDYGDGWNGATMTFESNGLVFSGPPSRLREMSGVWFDGALVDYEDVSPPTDSPTSYGYDSYDSYDYPTYDYYDYDYPTFGPPTYSPTPDPSPYPTGYPTWEPTTSPEPLDTLCTAVMVSTGSSPGAMVWSILSFTGQSCTPDSLPSEENSTYEHQCCFAHGDLVTINLQSLNGNGWSGGKITLFGVDYTLNDGEQSNNFASVSWGAPL